MAVNWYIAYWMTTWVLDNVVTVENIYKPAQAIYYLIVFDIAYYPMHYLFHTRLFWFIHKVHHQAQVNQGVDAFYMHPIELILTVLVFYIGTVMWIPTSPLIIYDMVAIGIKNTMWAHMGADAEHMQSPNHWLHHKYFNINYGNIFMDFIFDTFKQY